MPVSSMSERGVKKGKTLAHNKKSTKIEILLDVKGKCEMPAEIIPLFKSW